MLIRPEKPSDIADIFAVTQAAFANHSFSQQTEGFIVNALRAAEALTISLVAEVDNKLVGHIAFSPLTISDGTAHWYGLGPLAVLPAYQRQGIGKALIQQGLTDLKASAAQGCALVGDPNYYPQFGFKNSTQLSYTGIPPDYFFILPFTATVPQGIVSFHAGFGATH